MWNNAYENKKTKKYPLNQVIKKIKIKDKTLHLGPFQPSWSSPQMEKTTDKGNKILVN